MGKKVGANVYCEEGGEILFQIINEDSVKFEQIFTQRENVIYGINFDNDWALLHKSEKRQSFL